MVWCGYTKPWSCSPMSKGIFDSTRGWERIVEDFNVGGGEAVMVTKEKRFHVILPRWIKSKGSHQGKVWHSNQVDTLKQPPSYTTCSKILFNKGKNLYRMDETKTLGEANKSWKSKTWEIKGKRKLRSLYMSLNKGKESNQTTFFIPCMLLASLSPQPFPSWKMCDEIIWIPPCKQLCQWFLRR